MAESGKEPLTRRDMTIVLAALTGLSLIVGMAGNWLFYSRTEGRVLEERMASRTSDIGDLKTQVKTLADAVNNVQVNNAKLLELSLKIDEKIQRLENEAAAAKRKE